MKEEIKNLTRPLDLATRKFIEYISLFIKQFYHFV